MAGYFVAPIKVQTHQNCIEGSLCHGWLHRLMAAGILEPVRTVCIPSCRRRKWSSRGFRSLLQICRTCIWLGASWYCRRWYAPPVFGFTSSLIPAVYLYMEIRWFGVNFLYDVWTSAWDFLIRSVVISVVADVTTAYFSILNNCNIII